MQALSDAELVCAMTQGKNAALAEAELCRRFAPRIELYGRKHLRGATAAGELVQEVLLRVIGAIRGGQLENAQRLASFVLGTCRNASSETRRAHQQRERLARQAAAQADVLPQSAATDVEPVDADAVARLLSCVTRLPDREATIVRMSFWEDRAAEDIGARLGLSAGNVRVIRHRALARLIHCMNPERAT